MHSVLTIYPTAHKVEDLLKRESQAKGGLFGHRVTTFPQLTDALWREAGIARVMVGPVGERLALEEAITRAHARGLDLAFAPGNGVRDHLLRFIRELKSAAIEASDLRQACAGLPDTAARRMRGIAEIFAQYDNLLRKAGAADAHDRERLVVEVLHRMEQTGRRPRFLNGVEHLLMAEVYDPSLLQFMLVSSLIRLIGDATLTIQAEPFDLRISRFADLTWNRFVAEESISDKVLPHFVRRDGRMGRLGFVLTHLFAQAAPASANHGYLTSPATEGEGDEQELGARGIELPPQDSTIRIIEAPNPSREAEEVARVIRRMLELPTAEQIRLDRIAIIARDLQAYGDHLEAAFRRYRIPLSMAGPRPLSAFAPARVIRDILRIPAQNYHRDNMLSLCRAPFMRFAAARYPELPAQVGYIDKETRSLAECIESRRAELSRALQQKTDSTRLEIRRRLRDFDRAAQAWSTLLDLLVTLETPATLARYVAKTLNVLDRLKFDPLRDSLVDSSAATAGPLRSAFETLANEARIVAPRRRVALGEFALVVERVFDEVMVEPAANHVAGGVRAMAVADARGLDFDMVFIVGLNDGVFPAYHSEDPLFSDDAIRKLNAPLRDALRLRMGRFAPDAPGPILRTHYDRNAEEPFLFFLTMSMPARCVVLSYSAADDCGHPLPVSPFVAEVSRILNGAAPERISADDFILPATDCFIPDEFLARAALDSVLRQSDALHMADTTQIESILHRMEIERKREKYLALSSREDLVDDRRRQQNASNGAWWLSLDLSPGDEKLASASAYDGRIKPGPALSRFLLKGPDGGPREWSAAQLTELAACGYKFFARRILLLREPDEAGYEQTALETGNLVHEILHAIFTQARLSDGASLRSSGRQILDDFHRREHAQARNPAFFEVEWASIEAMVDEIIEYEIARQSRGEPEIETHHEFPLNLTLTQKSVTGGADPLKITLVGQIDRLEIYRDAGRIRRLKLIDYKTSRRLSDYAELLKPDHFACEDLQMPVYALGAVKHFHSEISSETGIELAYIALKNRDKESDPQPIPPAVLGSPLESAGEKTVAARILNLVADAVAGRFEVDPLKCGEYCPYRRVCRYRKPIFRS
ncbi:MAG: exodeoxyribonuclease V subunit gamma [Deltaproteobacteria bacterium]|nr:exodeoxyribonuclease V subunit gamma [Deltaproteobacteria bacterium]